MPICSVLGVLGLMVFQLCGFQAAWAQTASDRSGSARPGSQYTLFVELQQPYERSRARLQKMLKDEGYESFAEGEREVALVLTAEQIGGLFQARVQYRKAEASASGRTIKLPYLEGVRIPGRFGKLVQRVYFDPQRS